MEPTQNHPVKIRDWTFFTNRVGRRPTEEDQLRIECRWAGQLGHAKCGFCLECHMPRWLDGRNKDGKPCTHPRDKVWVQQT